MKKNNRTPSENGAMLARFLHGSLHHFALALVFVVFATLLEMITPKIITFTVDSVIGSEKAELAPPVAALIDRVGGIGRLRRNLLVPALAVVAVSLPAVILRYLFRVENAKGAERLVKTMRDTLFDKLMHLPISWHMQNKTGDVIQRCTSDVNTVMRFLSEQLTSIIRTVILVSLGLTFMFRMHVGLSIAATVFIPIIILYSALFHRRISRHFLEVDESESRLSAVVQENISGIRVVRAFGRESTEREKFKAANQEFAHLNSRLSRLFSAFWGIGDLISGLQVMIIIALGVLAANQGELTAGEFIAFISYNAMLIWPIRSLGRVISEMSKAGVSFERLAYLMNAPEERDRADALAELPRGAVAFEGVSFAYPGAEPILKEISFRAEAGETIGILGGTGSGKTTLMQLLCRLLELPEGMGRITVGGVDLRDVSLPALRSSIGIVLQEPFLFSRSLGENLTIALDEPNEAALAEATAIASLDEAIAHFTDGFKTPVGERGVTLSGGQKQRAAIARMLMKKTPILILDDSLSALDTETDAKIRAALTDRLENATVFLISHRTSTLAGADRILVLEDGAVREFGSHRELMQREDGLYRRIYLLQNREEGVI